MERARRGGFSHDCVIEEQAGVATVEMDAVADWKNVNVFLKVKQAIIIRYALHSAERKVRAITQVYHPRKTGSCC